MRQDFYNIHNYSQVNEFHNITPIKNIESIIRNGILSFEKAAKTAHESVAMNLVQARRNSIKVNGKRLHQYANLYFHARNPMMFSVKHKDICILRVDKSVGNLLNVVFSDRNASSDYAKFYPLQQVNQLDYELIFCQDWRDPKEIRYYEKKSKKCAEILILDRINYSHIIGAYVKSEIDKQRMIEKGFTKLIEVNPELFFL